MKGLSISGVIWRTAVLALLVPITSQLAAETADSAKISTLLDQVMIHASRAATDADTLDSFTRSKLNWESHSAQLRIIKDHVKELIVDFNQLVALRTEGSAWQEETIDRVSPLLKGIASNLTATISLLNENRDRTHSPPYQNYARTNWVLLDEAQKLISDIIAYDEAKDKAEDLARELALPTPAASGE